MPIFGAKSRAMRGCASKLACGHRIGPRRMQHFYGNPRRIRNFSLGRQSRRPLRRDFDALVPLSGRTTLSARRTHRFLRESAANPQLPSGPIVGIGAYGTPANPYCLANFERKAFLSQIFKRSCSQIRCTVTGGAYQSARKVSMCVRSDKKIGAHRNSTCSMHQTYPSALFSPIFSRAREKIGPSET